MWEARGGNFHSESLENWKREGKLITKILSLNVLKQQNNITDDFTFFQLIDNTQ